MDWLDIIEQDIQAANEDPKPFFSENCNYTFFCSAFGRIYNASVTHLISPKYQHEIEVSFEIKDIDKIPLFKKWIYDYHGRETMIITHFQAGIPEMVLTIHDGTLTHLDIQRIDTIDYNNSVIVIRVAYSHFEENRCKR